MPGIERRQAPRWWAPATVIVTVVTAALMVVIVVSAARWVNWLWWVAALLGLLGLGVVWLILTGVGVWARQWALPLIPVVIVVALAIPATDDRAFRLAVWLSQSQLRDAARKCDSSSVGWVRAVRVTDATRTLGICELGLPDASLNSDYIVYHPGGRPRDRPPADSVRSITHRHLTGDLYLRIYAW